MTIELSHQVALLTTMILGCYCCVTLHWRIMSEGYPLILPLQSTKWPFLEDGCINWCVTAIVSFGPGKIMLAFEHSLEVAVIDLLTCVMWYDMMWCGGLWSERVLAMQGVALSLKFRVLYASLSGEIRNCMITHVRGIVIVHVLGNAFLYDVMLWLCVVGMFLQ